MTAAERQARFRAAHANGAPKVRYKRPGDRRRRPQRWRDAVAELVELQSDYQAWLDALPPSLADSAVDIVHLSDVAVLELIIVPDISGGTARASLKSLRLS